MTKVKVVTKTLVGNMTVSGKLPKCPHCKSTNVRVDAGQCVECGRLYGKDEWL
jgi:Zn finger protein HypA/HybF involved in hydrogenase expression